MVIVGARRSEPGTGRVSRVSLGSHPSDKAETLDDDDVEWGDDGCAQRFQRLFPHPSRHLFARVCCVKPVCCAGSHRFTVPGWGAFFLFCFLVLVAPFGSLGRGPFLHAGGGAHTHHHHTHTHPAIHPPVPSSPARWRGCSARRVRLGPPGVWARVCARRTTWRWAAPPGVGCTRPPVCRTCTLHTTVAVLAPGAPSPPRNSPVFGLFFCEALDLK